MITSNPLETQMPSAKNQDEPEYDDHANAGEDHERSRTRIRRRRFFPTKIGGVCVNAKTGQQYPWSQGSFDEMRLYKVIDATAYYDKDGFRRRRKDPVNKEPLLLYYDSPQEYGRHNKSELNQSFVNWWSARRDAAFPDGTFDKAAYSAWISENPRWVPSRQVKETTGVSDEEW